MKHRDLAALGTKERQEKLIELKKELMKLNSQRATRTVSKNPRQMRTIKRTIAQLLTPVTKK